MASGDSSSTGAAGSALPAGTRLGEFELRRVIGVGGFGIVYLAFDHGLEREVAIKEYMPSSLASRTATLHVSLTSPSNAETFALGLRSFINEARLLARFDHPSLIKVHRFWEDRGTAYMVMPLYRGRTLRDVRLSMGQSPDEAWLRGLLEPLLGALEVLHREDVFHRDIAPDNILIGDDGVPMLLDFGAARHVISGRSQDLTAILKPSYAPIEQYGESASLKQGAWTDLYALGATLHFLVRQAPPPPATARMVHEDELPLAATPTPGLSPAFLQSIDWMLAPRPADRPKSVAELREVLSGRRAVPTRVAPPATVAWQRTAAQRPDTEPEPEIDLDLTIVQPISSSAALAAMQRSATPPVAPPPPPSPAWQPSPQAPPAPPRRAAAPATPAAQVSPAKAAGGSSANWVIGAVLALVVAAGGLWAWKRAPASPMAAAPSPASAVLSVAPQIAPPSRAEPPVAAVAAPPPVPAPVAPLVTTAASPPTAPSKPVAVAAQREPQASNRPVTATRGPQPSPMAAPTLMPAQDARPMHAPAPTRVQAIDATPPVQRPQPTRTTSDAGGYGTRGSDASPAPVAPPAATAPAGHPREGCGGRVFLALHACLVRQCVKPQYAEHEECIRVKQIEERAARTPG